MQAAFSLRSSPLLGFLPSRSFELVLCYTPLPYESRLIIAFPRMRPNPGQELSGYHRAHAQEVNVSADLPGGVGVVLYVTSRILLRLLRSLPAAGALAA